MVKNIHDDIINDNFEVKGLKEYLGHEPTPEEIDMFREIVRDLANKDKMLLNSNPTQTPKQDENLESDIFTCNRRRRR
jgi:hypothetical protein